jgi:hypothetical protein
MNLRHSTISVFALVGSLLLLVLPNATAQPFQSSGASAQKSSAIDQTATIQPTPRITQSIDDNFVIRVPHTTHPLATPANDRGRTDATLPMNRIVLLLKSSDRQQATLKRLLDSQQDSESRNYHQWLEPEQYAAQFGPSQMDIDKIASWLNEHGFTVDSVARGKQWIEFSGTAGQVETTFHTEIHNYVVNGKPHIANAMDISLPQALTPVVTGILSLHDFKPKHMYDRMFQVHRDPATGKLVPVASAISAEFTPPGVLDPGHFLAPGDWSRIYNTKPLLDQNITGAGISIAIVGSDSDIELSDVRTFRQIFQLPAKDPVFDINGVDPGLLFLSPPEIEAELDVEWSGAVAPGATVRLVTSASTASTFGGLLSISYIVDNRLAPIMSASIGQCEAFLGPAGNAFLNSSFQQAAAEGITVFVSSGDNGPAGCDPQVGSIALNGQNVSGFASTPYNVAVGGTTFAENGLDANYWEANNRPDFSSAKGYIPEAVWNESCDPTVDPNGCGDGNYHLSSSSGGASGCTQSILQNGFIICQSGYPKPSWQAGKGVPADNARDIPDIALASAGGHDGYLICVEGTCQTSTSNGQTMLENAFIVGGTSAATPAMAGIMALIEQKIGAYQGLINFNLYKLAAADKLPACNSSHLLNPQSPNSCNFYDTTAGNNNVPGQVGFNAGVGFDLTTGLGSVNAENLLNAWSTIPKLHSATKLSANPTPIVAQHGQPIPINVIVKPASGTGAPSGDFSVITNLGSILGGSLTNGSFTGNINGLPGGHYSVQARYAGDAMFASSSSNSLGVDISPEESLINVQPALLSQIDNEAPPNTPTQMAYGDGLFLQINVQGQSGIGSATGNLTIQLDDQVPFGPFSITQPGTAFIEVDGLNIAGFNDVVGTGLSRLTSTGILPGTHTFKVSYSGDNSFKAGKAAPLVVNVRKDRSQGAVFPVQSVFTAGVPIDFILQQVPFFTAQGFKGLEQPTGIVRLYDCGTGDTGCANPVPISAPIKLTTSSLETGNGQLLAQANYRGALSVGTHALRLGYSGDSNYFPQGLNGVFVHSTLITVNPPGGIVPVIQLRQLEGTITVGESESYIASVKPPHAGSPMPTGTVSLNDQFGNSFGPVSLSAGNASFVVPMLFAGHELIFVNYSGDANYTPVNSVVLVTTIVKPAEPTVTLNAGSSVVPENSRTLLTATVIGAPLNPNLNTPFAENGQVEFFDSVNGQAPTVLGNGPVVLTIANGGSQISLLSTVLPAGTNVITAKFLGTPEWLARTSNPVVVNVKAPASTLTPN